MKDKWLEETFPKCKLFEIKWFWFSKRNWNITYFRMANAGQLYFGPLNLIWRLPWHPRAAYNKGWDAHFRQENKLGEYATKPGG